MNLYEFLFGPEGKPIKRKVRAEITEGSDEIEFVSGEKASYSEAGSIDFVRIENRRFYPTCGCSIDEERHPLGGLCSDCHRPACQEHFSSCSRCNRPLCSLDTKTLDDGSDVCGSCRDWEAPRQLASKIIGLLTGGS